MKSTESSEQNQQNADRQQTEPYKSERIYTIPNIICVIRLLGSFGLVAIAWLNEPEIFLGFFIFLSMTDWIDGKLAIVLNQRTVIGARLDSWADAALYAAFLLGAVLLKGSILGDELAWIIPAVASYFLSTGTGFWKYGRWPSYHTRAAKTTWFLAIVGAVSLFSGWSLWPLRIALLAGTLTNLEALLITIISPIWRHDVTSIYHVWRDQNSGAE